MSGFTVTVSPAGEVVDCRLQATSFYPELDAKGCAALQSAHFAPATDPQGAVVYGTVDVEVRWPQGVATVGAAYPDVELSLDRLPVGATGRPIADLVLAVDPTGVVGSCQVVASTGSAALDAVACSSGGKAAGVKAVTSKDGAPHASVQGLRVRFVVFPQYDGRKEAREIGNVYPERAQRMDVTGFAVVRCEPGSDGVLKDCSVAEEDPPGVGFGRAGVNLVQVGQMRVAPDQHGEVFVPIGFYLKPCPKPPEKWVSVCGNRYPKGY